MNTRKLNVLIKKETQKSRASFNRLTWVLLYDFISFQSAVVYHETQTTIQGFNIFFTLFSSFVLLSNSRDIYAKPFAKHKNTHT